MQNGFIGCYSPLILSCGLPFLNLFALLGHPARKTTQIYNEIRIPKSQARIISTEHLRKLSKLKPYFANEAYLEWFSEK